MAERIEALRALLQDPSSNFAATGTAISILVLLAVIFVLLLIAYALPTREDIEDHIERATTGTVSKRRMPRWLAALFGVALAALVLLGATAFWYQSTSTNEYCAQTCHAMAGPAEKWAISSHAGVSCIRCHEGVQWQSFGAGVEGRARSLYYQLTGRKAQGRGVPAKNCLSCHIGLLDAQLTARNGEPFTHAALLKEDTSCTSCHGPQGHVLPHPEKN